ncbi:MAG TPA: biopolymer transporter ExbD [Pyrinomonadaceae bacterium]|nr:biopolymer transporter ExbD [Pyrinomonadaceae bacterium]
MAMTSGGGGGLQSNINVTPMVDIMLVLLIIFMVITPLLQSGVSVTLPHNDNPDPDQNIIKDTSVVIAITENGDIYIGKKKIDKDQLKAEIDQKMATKEDKDRIVYIRSDINANYGAVVDTINVIRDSGIDQIGLVADKNKGAGGPATAAPTPAS